jgi:hypothetical protein
MSLRWVTLGTKPFLDLKPTTHDAGDLYWAVNQVEIRLRPLETTDLPAFDVQLGTIRPNFDGFVIATRGRNEMSRQSQTGWQLEPGANEPRSARSARSADRVGKQ